MLPTSTSDFNSCTGRKLQPSASSARRGRCNIPPPLPPPILPHLLPRAAPTRRLPLVPVLLPAHSSRLHQALGVFHHLRPRSVDPCDGLLEQAASPPAERDPTRVQLSPSSHAGLL